MYKIQLSSTFDLFAGFKKSFCSKFKGMGMSLCCFVLWSKERMYSMVRRIWYRLIRRKRLVIYDGDVLCFVLIDWYNWWWWLTLFTLFVSSVFTFHITKSGSHVKLNWYYSVVSSVFIAPNLVQFTCET